jgi:hypothetical protein
MVNVLAATIYKGISEIEVFWVLLALFGLIFSLFNFLEARKDVQALDRAKITNGRRLIATTARFQDGGRSLVHLIFLGIGLGSWTLTDMPLSDLPTNVLNSRRTVFCFVSVEKEHSCPGAIRFE